MSRFKCQFPLWPHHAVATHVFCEAPVIEGSPYCAEHHVRCHRKTYNKSLSWLIGEPKAAPIQRNDDDATPLAKEPDDSAVAAAATMTPDHVPATITNDQI